MQEKGFTRKLELAKFHISGARRLRARVTYYPDSKKLYVNTDNNVNMNKIFTPEAEPVPPLDRDTINQFFYLTEVYCNQNTATLAQADFIAKYKIKRYTEEGYNIFIPYQSVRTAVSEAGLLVDNGHECGTSIVKKEIPRDAVKFLFSLAGTGSTWEEVEAYMNRDKFDINKAWQEILHFAYPTA